MKLNSSDLKPLNHFPLKDIKDLEMSQRHILDAETQRGRPRAPDELTEQVRGILKQPSNIEARLNEKELGSIALGQKVTFANQAEHQSFARSKDKDGKPGKKDSEKRKKMKAENKLKYKISRFNLRISEPTIQKQFVEYIRAECFNQSLLIFFCLLLISLILLFLLIRDVHDSNKDDSRMTQLLCLMFCIPTFFLGVNLYMAHRRKYLADGLASSLMLSVCILLHLIYMNSSFDAYFAMDNGQRNTLSLVFLLHFYCAMNLMTTEYVVGLILRILFGWYAFFFIMFMRNTYGENNLAASLGLCLGMFFFFELVVYLNYRASVRLFLRVQVSIKQENQLSHLLDMVPDKVLISSIGSEGRHMRSIYSNQKMNEFFGCDLVELSRHKQSMAASGAAPVENWKSRSRDPFRRRIFEDHSHLDRASDEQMINSAESVLGMQLTMSLTEVIERNKVERAAQQQEIAASESKDKPKSSKKNQKGESQTLQLQVVSKANRYEDSESSKKIVQMKIMDVLFDNELCNLVYMRDITGIVQQNAENFSQRNGQAAGQKQEQKAINELCQLPTCCLSKALTTVRQGFSVGDSRQAELLLALSQVKNSVQTLQQIQDSGNSRAQAYMQRASCILSATEVMKSLAASLEKETLVSFDFEGVDRMRVQQHSSTRITLVLENLLLTAMDMSSDGQVLVTGRWFSDEQQNQKTLECEMSFLPQHQNHLGDASNQVSSDRSASHHGELRKMSQVLLSASQLIVERFGGYLSKTVNLTGTYTIQLRFLISEPASQINSI